MNTYTARGLARACAAGERILVLTSTMSEMFNTFNTLKASTTLSHSITRANGQQRITHPSGGTILIRSINSSGHRGVSVDTVYIDGFTPSDRQMQDIAPCIATSKTGRIIKA